MKPRSIPCRTAALALVAFLLMPVAGAQGAIIYWNDFENAATASAGFSLPAGSTITALTSASLPTDSAGITSPNQSMWLGRLGNGTAKSATQPEAVVLTLDNVVPGQQYGVTFDLFIGDSWDGSADHYGPDTWRLTAVSGGSAQTLVNATFSNGKQGVNLGAYSPQSYSDATPLGQNGGIYVGWTGADAHSPTMSTDYTQDYSIYYFGHGAGNPSLAFTAGAPTATLTFERRPIASGDSPLEYWAVDNLLVTGAATPEPATLSLAAMGLVGLVLRRRARGRRPAGRV